MKTLRNEFMINPLPGGRLVTFLANIYKKLKKTSDTAIISKETRNTIEGQRKKRIENFINPSEKVKMIFSGVEKFPFLNIYVHGSWADETKTPFSDLDDLVIIHNEKVKSKLDATRAERWLNNVDMLFCRIDPLQHHGHWIVYADKLEDLDESVIPLSVIDNSMLIQGPEKVNYVANLDKTKAGLKNNITVTCDNITRWMKKYTAKQINSYEMKALIGSFLLLPAYLFQHNGKEISKREAIERKNEIFSMESCLLLDKCSKIRDEWGIVTESSNFKYLKYASYIFTNPHLFRRFSMKFAPKFPNSQFPHIPEREVKNFLEEVKKNANN